MAAKPLKPWIWQRPDWPEFYWDSARLARPLANARRAQGELIGMARLLDPDSDLRAQLEVLTSDGVATSAIEGERLDPNAVRSSLARRLGLPTAGLPAPPRSVEGLVDVLIDATQKLDKPLTVNMLGNWDGLLRAGVAHAWFELIHPFEDGNGRVGRALLDRALAQDENRSVRLYSLSARFMAARNEYYDALQALSRGTLDATDLLR